MISISKVFRTAAVCAAFVSATAAFTSCANGTSTTGTDTTTSASPAAADTMTSPSTDTSTMQKDSM